MSYQHFALRRSGWLVWIAIASLVIALLLPILSTTQRADAAQILDRYIHMDSSANTVETDYVVEFQVPNGATVGSLRVEFCNENPIPGSACDTSTTSGDNVPDLDASAGNVITISNFQFGTAGTPATRTAGTDNTASCLTPTLQAVGAGATHFDIHCNSAETVTSGSNDYIYFTVNDPNNPTNTTSGNDNDSFYARIYTFAGTSATAYNANQPPLGNYEGGVALSTAEQINVEARVQETLTFTVGVDAAADNCADISGSDVELGVLSSGINYASVNGFDTVTPNTDVACAEVTTNAANGVSVYYVGDNLSVGTASCSDADTDIDDNNVLDDLCINRDDVDDTAIVGGNEQWGLQVTNTSEYGSITNTLTATDEYDGDDVSNDEFIFVPNAVSRIAYSTSVLDQAIIEVDMAGTASIVTPTGVYDTVLTFIATAQF